jgi:hypothetical protein
VGAWGAWWAWGVGRGGRWGVADRGDMEGRGGAAWPLRGVVGGILGSAVAKWLVEGAEVVG